MKWTMSILCALVLIAPNALVASDDDAVTSHIPRQQVNSSGIASIGYSKRRHILEIEFSNGAIYRYVGVAASVYRDLLAAESKTRYYDLNIKRNYRSIRVRPRVKDRPNN